jgi:glucose-6-phosphate 1-epimerase
MSLIFCQQQQLDELESIRIEHPLFKATLLLQGAQLIEFCPENNQYENLLWLSSKAEYKSAQSVRGGIPICWPWFGDIHKNPAAIKQQINSASSSSAHGFARNLAWQVNSIKEDCQQVVIELQLSADEKSKAFWPYEFDLIARFTFSQQLKVELITLNRDPNTFRVSQALHTYLPTEDISQSYIHNAHNTRYIDALDQWQDKNQHGRITFTQETDRLYFFEPNNENSTESFVLRAETPNQQLNIRSENSRSAVIWNPWVNKSKALSQFNDEDYKQMFCIETANVLEDYKLIEPGESCCLTLELSKY